MSRFNLQEELNSLSADPSLYPIASELDPSSISERELDAHLSSAIESVINDPDSLTHSTGVTFDVFCSILKHADSPNVSPGVLGKTLDVITTGLSNQVNAVVALARAENDDDPDGPAAHRTPLEMWAFLLQWFVSVGEKTGKSGEDAPRTTKGKGKKKATTGGNGPTFDWELVLPSVLGTMHRALRLPTSRIWRTSSEKEAFIGCFVKPCYQLCEVESHLKQNEIKLGIFKTICLSVKFHGHGFGAQTSIIQNLTYFEHLSEPMAELLAILDQEFDHPQLADDVLRDVSSKTFAPGDQKGPRSFSRFLVKLAELSPRVVQKQMALLLAHLDSDVSRVWFSSLTPGAPDADGSGGDHRYSHTRHCGIDGGGRCRAKEQADQEIFRALDGAVPRSQLLRPKQGVANAHQALRVSWRGHLVYLGSPQHPGQATKGPSKDCRAHDTVVAGQDVLGPTVLDPASHATAGDASIWNAAWRYAQPRRVAGAI